MRIIAVICLALAFLFAIFGWHISHAGALAVAILGLFFWCLSELWDFSPYGHRGTRA
jgi:hypothetical protein